MIVSFPMGLSGRGLRKRKDSGKMLNGEQFCEVAGATTANDGD